VVELLLITHLSSYLFFIYFNYFNYAVVSINCIGRHTIMNYGCTDFNFLILLNLAEFTDYLLYHINVI